MRVMSRAGPSEPRRGTRPGVVRRPAGIHPRPVPSAAQRVLRLGAMLVILIFLALLREPRAKGAVRTGLGGATGK